MSDLSDLEPKEKFPTAEPSVIDPAALKRLEELAAPLPDAVIPHDPEERRKLLENMFKGAMSCFFGTPAAPTPAEFEKQIDEHNAGIHPCCPNGIPGPTGPPGK